MRQCRLYIVAVGVAHLTASIFDGFSVFAPHPLKRMDGWWLPNRSTDKTNSITGCAENQHRHMRARLDWILLADQKEANASDLSDIEQTLDLWTGVLTSRFKVAGKGVIVRVCVHPGFDMLAVTIESWLISAGRLSVRFAFPYGSSKMQAADWSQPAKHQTNYQQNRNRWILVVS